MKHRTAIVLVLEFAAVTALGPAPSAEAQDATVGAPTIFDDFRDVRVDGSGRPVASRKATLGHLEITLDRGTLYPLATRTGRHVGWFFRGDGSYIYRSEEAEDRATFEANVRRVTRLQAAYNNVHDAFHEFFVLRSGLSIPGLDDVSGGEPGGEGSSGSLDPSAARRFEALWKEVMLGDLEFDHQAAAIEANGPPGQYVYLEILGELQRVGYTYDRQRSWLESLFTFRKFGGIAYRFLRPISDQALEGRGEVPPEAVLEHADLKLVTEDNRSGSVDSTLRLKIARNDARILVFYLSNNRDPDSWRWQSDRRALRVETVEENGGPLAFSHRYHELAVDLGKPRKQGETVTLHVRISGDFITDRKGEFSDNYRDLYNVIWFPRPTSPAARQFTFTLEVRCPKPFVAVTSGDAVERREEGRLNILEAEGSKPVENVAVFFGKYTPAVKKFGNLEVRVYGYGVTHKKDTEQIADMIGTYTLLYGDLFGPYPYREIEVVELPTYSFFGISPSGVIILTSRSYDSSDPEVRESLGNRGVNALLAHEVAHQWFFHRARPWDYFEENWLSESLAEYASGLAMGILERNARKQGKGVQAKMKGFKELLAEWWRDTREVGDRGTIRGAYRVSGDRASIFKRHLLYSRGPLVLHMLRTLVGDQRFLAILRTYLDEANWGLVDTDDLARAATKVVGEDMSWFFDQWTRQAGIPEIQVEHQIQRKAGGYVLTGTVRQEGTAFFRMYVPLILEFPGGRRMVRLVDQRKPVQPFAFDLPAEPVRVLVDPANNNLATYRR